MGPVHRHPSMKVNAKDWMWETTKEAWRTYVGLIDKNVQIKGSHLEKLQNKALVARLLFEMLEDVGLVRLFSRCELHA